MKRNKDGSERKPVGRGKQTGDGSDRISGRITGGLSGSSVKTRSRSKWGPAEETEDMLLREMKTDKERMKARNEMIIKRDFT